MKHIILVFVLAFSVSGLAQNNLEGLVVDAGSTKELPLPGANVYWVNSQIGTITDENGTFKIPFSDAHSKLIISYVGYTTDTLTVLSPDFIKHALNPLTNLKEVVVQKKRDALEKSYFKAQNVVTLNSAELLKAACCNLSESFETNPAIDVNFNNAVNGTKQIEMLGLTSPYILITQENIPNVRGASQTYGLTFTPGTWVESIQITKGAGSVVNGYESISGQINTELVKPTTDVPLFVNMYGNQNGRLELNVHGNTKLTDKLSFGTYLHHNRRTIKEDNNNDGFLDAPLSNQLNVLTRLQYQDSEKGWVSFFNMRFLNDEKQIGQLNFEPEKRNNTEENSIWGGEINTDRFDASVKLGYVFPELPFQSFGFQTAYSYHNQESYYGVRNYNIEHESAFANLMFNSIIGDTRSKFKTGVSVAYDEYDELVDTNNYARMDASVGAFFEYSYENMARLSLTAGLRVDAHNRLGNFMTPRLHVRYTPWGRGSLRGSFGRGRRAANIFAENQQLFASARSIVVSDVGGSVYGLDPEDAWNYGVSFLQGFSLFNKQGSLTIDYYKTDFKNQVVVDWENPRAVYFYNLDGKSFANSFQVEVDYSLLKSLKLRAAYKFYDVQTDYAIGTLQKPLFAQHRYFANVSYETPIKDNGAHWRFDATYHGVGEQRLPSTNNNPPQYRLGEIAEPYTQINGQITKVFSNTFEVYLGAENLTNYNLKNPILGAENPFGENFDSTLTYAPIMGRMFYAGFRLKIL